MRDPRIAVVTGGAGALGTAVVAALRGSAMRVIAPTRKELDLSNEEAVRRHYGEIAEEHGGLDVLVNLAGGFAAGAAADSPWSLWQQQIDANLKTTVLSCAAAVPHLVASGGGSILNVAARPALHSGAGLAPYAASKRAVLQLTEALAAELLGRSVAVNAIVPSTIDTPANRRDMPDQDPSLWPKPEEIARVVAFLVSREASLISGAAIPVYGRA